MAQGITRKQQQTLSFIQQYIFENDVSPSYEEIGAALGGASKSYVQRIIHALAERGAISFLPGRKRSIKLIGHHRHRVWVEVPAEPDDAEFEAAKAQAGAAAKNGEDPYQAFWAAMLDRYQQED